MAHNPAITTPVLHTVSTTQALPDRRGSRHTPDIRADTSERVQPVDPAVGGASPQPLGRKQDT